MHSAWHCNSVPKSKFCRHRPPPPPPPPPPAPARPPAGLRCWGGWRRRRRRRSVVSTRCECTSLCDCDCVVCSLKFIVSGEKLIKHLAFEMRMTKGYFRSFVRTTDASDVITWIVIGGSAAAEYSRTPRHTTGINNTLSCGGREGGRGHYYAEAQEFHGQSGSIRFYSDSYMDWNFLPTLSSIPFLPTAFPFANAVADHNPCTCTHIASNRHD